MCAAKPYFAEPCHQRPPLLSGTSFKVFDCLISTSSNCSCLQTGPQSRHRATWHTIPLQAMVFWLACELLCVLPSLILLNLATNDHPFCLAHLSRCLIALFPPVAIVVVCKLVHNLGTERHGTLFPCKQWSSGWLLASCYVCCQALFC